MTPARSTVHAILICILTVVGIMVAPACFTSQAFGVISLTGPNDEIQVELKLIDNRPVYNIRRDGVAMVEDSPLGITIDGVQLGENVVQITTVSNQVIEETYITRGPHAEAVNHYRAATIRADRTGGGDPSLTIHVRVYDDGMAWRYEIPGTTARTISGEAGGWKIPSGSVIWQNNNTFQYEGIVQSAPIENPDNEISFPTTCVLPNGSGFVCVTESDVMGYSGASLRSDYSPRLLNITFRDNSQWTVSGGGFSPWRVAICVSSLNALVNSDLVSNTARSHNSSWFPDGVNTSWIQPGRSLWSWWPDGTIDWNGQRHYADKASELGFEYILVDEGWENWSSGGKDKWQLVSELVDYAAARDVKINLWRHYARSDGGISINNPANDYGDMRWFFDQVKSTGAAGVKIDFMDSESQAMLQFYEAALRIGAEKQLMINFHGANKPAGEPRTYPNEMTREGVRGWEYNKFGQSMPYSHMAALPFVRMIAGHLDFTPGYFGPNTGSGGLGGTSHAAQMAMGIIYNSTIQHWVSNPSTIDYGLPAGSPQREVFVNIPTVWDETIVPDYSRIGELAAFARRRDNLWFLALLNGRDSNQTVNHIDLSFLAGTTVTRAVLLSDNLSNPAMFESVAYDTFDPLTYDLNVTMRGGGGYVAMFEVILPPPVNPPGDVTAIYNNPDCSHGTCLTWQDQSDNETGFIIQRRPFQNENIWTTIATLPADTTQYCDTSHLHGMITYTYRVGAYSSQ